MTFATFMFLKFVSLICDNGVRIMDVAVLRYTAACSKLLVQIKAAFKQLNDDDYPSVEEFVRKCKVINYTLTFSTELLVLLYCLVLITVDVTLFINKRTCKF